MEYTAGFSYRRAQLQCEGVPVEKIAERQGTPTYVYSRANIEQAYSRLDAALGEIPHTVCYAVKANSNLGILRVFAGLGSGFDIVSGDESLLAAIRTNRTSPSFFGARNYSGA